MKLGIVIKWYEVILSFCLLTSNICYNSFGQSNTIKGLVVDDQEKSVVGAVCYLKNNSHLGSITDSTGHFAFHYSQHLSFDTLIISTLGHATLIVPISSIDFTGDTTSFVQNRKAIVLEGLEVKAKSDYYKQLYLKALAKIPKNYPNKRHQFKGFRRKISTDVEGYTHLFEASFLVEDPGYNKSSSKIKQKVFAFRQSKEFGKGDTAWIRSRQDQLRRYHERTGKGLESIRFYLIGGYPRPFKDHMFLYFPVKAIDYFSFELTGVEIVEKDTICQIAVVGSAIHPNSLNYVKINKSNLAIVERSLAFVKHNRIISQHKILYEKINRRYYPVYIKTIGRRHINESFKDDEFDISEMWVSEIYTGKFKKLPKQSRLSFDSNYDCYGIPYDSVYWSGFEPLMEHGIADEVRLGLEKHSTLEAQFRQERQRHPAQLFVLKK